MSEGQPKHWPHELRLDDQAGPAPYITRAKVDALVWSALDQAGFTESPAVADLSAGRRSSIPPGRRSSIPPKPGIGVRSLAAAVVLACLTVGSASAAVMWYARSRHETPQPAPIAKPVSPRAAVDSRVRPPASEPALAPSVVPSELPARTKPARAPEDWLIEGNRLRADKRWAKADEAYARAAQQAPNSQTAYVARVASAAVRLEHLHDPRGALARYRAALAQEPHGVLREEIQFGIADAQRALGDRDAERSALELFLREHPTSPLASQAKARLD